MSFSVQLVSTLGLLLAGFLCLRSEASIIDLPGLGSINGTTAQSHWSGRTIYQYKGIPFAEPPVGELRWKPPVKFATPWTGVREFNDFGPICPQGTGFIMEINLPVDKPKASEQSEDCLSINVYTNKLDGGGNGTGLPVMVFVHGGALIGGDARPYDPYYLLEKDVVLATVQYRLGPLGFLSLKNAEIPGNQGLLDVALALEWVRDNIEHFGGDPSRVTIIGQSAGAAVVTSMLFSPRTDGLFQRIIAHSGSLLGTWAVDADPVTHGTTIARLALCFQTEEAALAACLRSKSVDQILAAHAAFLAQDVALGGRALGGHHIVWDEAGVDSFIRKNPAELLVSGDFQHKPMIAGVTKHEGAGFFAFGYDYIIKPFELDTNIEYLKRKAVKQVLDFGGIEDQTGYTRSFMSNKYFPNGELGNFTAMIPGLIDILSVSFLKACSMTMASEMNRYADTYYYSFNFFGKHTTFPDHNDYPFAGGISHTDDLFYLFKVGQVLDEQEDAMARQMVELWTNFATNGVPTAQGVPEWPMMTSAEGPYLRFDSTHKVLDNFIGEEYMITIKEGLTEPPTDTTTEPNSTDQPGMAAGFKASIFMLIVTLSLHLRYIDS